MDIKSIKDINVEQVCRFVGGIIALSLGGVALYKAGRQEGCRATEEFVANFEPEGYERLCKILSEQK